MSHYIYSILTLRDIFTLYVVLLIILCELIGLNDINLNLCPLDLHHICSSPNVKYVNRQSTKLDLTIVKVSVMSSRYRI